MESKTVTRANLVQAVVENTDLSRHDSAIIVENVFDEIIEGMAKFGYIKLSSFATFDTRQKRQRIGRNPKTGQEVPITPRRVVSFRPSLSLKKKILDSHRERGCDN